MEASQVGSKLATAPKPAGYPEQVAPSWPVPLHAESYSPPLLLAHADEERRRLGQAERLGNLEIDDQRVELIPPASRRDACPHRAARAAPCRPDGSTGH